MFKKFVCLHSKAIKKYFYESLVPETKSNYVDFPRK